MGFLSGKNRRSFASSWIRLATLGLLLSILFQAVSCDQEPTESQCRSYIEKALKQKQEDELTDEELPKSDTSIEQEEDATTDELTETTDDSPQLQDDELIREGKDDDEADDDDSSRRERDQDEADKEDGDKEDEEEGETSGEEDKEKEGEDVEEKDVEETEDKDEAETESKKGEQITDKEGAEEEEKENDGEDEGDNRDEADETVEPEEKEDAEEEADKTSHEDEGHQAIVEVEKDDESEDVEDLEKAEQEDQEEEDEGEGESPKESETEEEKDLGPTDKAEDGKEIVEAENAEETEKSEETEHGKDELEKDADEEVEKQDEGEEEKQEGDITEKVLKSEYATAEKEETKGDEEQGGEGPEDESSETAQKEDAELSEEGEGEEEPTPEEDLIKEVTIPENLRPRDHITKILRLDEDSVEKESVIAKATDSTLKGLKTLYDNAIKPLEMLYKYRDLSNRHFGDPEIFSKPLILFMGPWSGGKSTTINYLLDNEFTETSLRTGAEPSPAYFNILMYGDEEEILDGTQLAADCTFSGLQKFGQGLLDRLKGYKLPNRLLEKVNIVEIPGILEIRKQVQRLFPFNDACQWFIDRADIIFLVYDPSKLDVGPETEAILDQLKGREYQTRIILNKADQVKPEELMRVQGTLIWNISPLMSSTEPPVMYSTSLWSLPYENGAPTRLLHAQERAFLRDLREAIDKRVDNKIASARRFAVRVRNHAKMVDCYLTTYYNHKTFFGNRKKISDDIIENPQKYHIYEGLSTLTNISRYDLPDPDVYRDFFKLNPLYDFTKLSDTCTYFRGCPINKLDVAIAYDLPELVGKYKKALEASKLQESEKTNS